MAVNKVILNGETILDLTADTAGTADVRLGETFHKSDGTQGTGSYVPTLQDKTVTPLEEQQVVTADEGYEGLNSVTVSAAQLSSGDFEDFLSGNLTILNVPEGVTSIAAHLFENNLDICELRIPEGVTTIGECAFKGCANLTSIYLPNSLINIGNEAFSGIAPSGMVLFDCSFANSGSHTGFQALVSSLPNTFMPISLLFAEPIGPATSADSVIAKGYTFDGETILLLDVSGTGAMMDFESAGTYGEQITVIHEGITRVGNNFQLTAYNVCLPASLTSIGANVFSESIAPVICYSGTPEQWEAIDIDDSNSATITTIIDSSNFISKENLGATGTDNITYEYDKGTLTISGTGAMNNNPLLPFLYIGPNIIYKLTVSDGVTNISKIGDGDLLSPLPLNEVSLAGSVTTVGLNAFKDLSNLKTVTIAAGTTTISDCAFMGCGLLSSISIPNTVTTIGLQAFFGCASLTSITIPASVTSIGANAFTGCTNLEEIIYLGNQTQWNAITIGEYNTVLTTKVKYVVETGDISKDADDDVTYTLYSNGDLVLSGTGETRVYEVCTYSPFSNKQTIQRLIIEDGITSISQALFRYCRALTSVSIPNSVTYLSGFENCSGLTNITIPDSVTTLGSSAFSGCTGLTSVVIPDSVTTLGSSAFSGCTGLTSVNIPSTVTSISHYLFSGCYHLTSITIPTSVTSIMVAAFRDCINLTDIIIPSSVNTIVQRAFYNCSSLKNIIIPNSITSIADATFYGCSGLEIIVIPNTVLTIGDTTAYSTGVFGDSYPDNIIFNGTATQWAAAIANRNTGINTNHTTVIYLQEETA